MIPSDPDFCYELSGLECVMHIPLTYPVSGKPALEITNESLDTRHKILVQQRFESLVNQSLTTHGSGTLLAWMNGLDKQLARVFADKPTEGEHSSKTSDIRNKATEGPALGNDMLGTSLEPGALVA